MQAVLTMKRVANWCPGRDASYTLLAALTCLVALAATAGAVWAAPPAKTGEIEISLPPEQQVQYDKCQAQEQERATLAATGIEADMNKGPQWAKENLPAKRLSDILRFIHLDEQVRFRCGDVFAAAQVAREEEAARLAMERRIAAQRAWEEKRAEMLKNIPNPVRKPRPKQTRVVRRKGIPPPPARSPL